MRRRRTIYFNDARHYYLFVFEPPMRLEDAWRPVDEAAGTAVDTFIHGVSRADGLFYPSEVGLRFGVDMRPFGNAPYWRVWENMQSLIDRDLDPLSVLIDRAHHKGMDFFASLRMGDVPGLDPGYTLREGGRGYVHPELRDHQFAVLQELATQYPVEGVELDFAAPPQGSAFYFKPEDASEHTPVMTAFVRRVAEMVRGRSGTPGLVGARVYPTEALNLKAGMDVEAWLAEGLVDFVVPLVYGYRILDADMPIGWLVEGAHRGGISVYGMLQPLYALEDRPLGTMRHASAAMMRAAAANFWELGVDGLYTWYLRWPLGEVERTILTELGDPDLARGGDKHYFLRRRYEPSADHDYEAHLPLELPVADAHRRYQVPFRIADDTGSDRVRRVLLRISVENLVSADRLDVRLNGQPLSGEACRRSPIRRIEPYAGQWLEFDLQRVHPRKGGNRLEIGLVERPANLTGGVSVEDVEIIVEYGAYPVGLDARSGSQPANTAA